MGKVKGLVDSANQKILEGLAEAGLTPHEEYMLDQIMKEDERLQEAEKKSLYVKGLVTGMALITLVFLIGKVI